jgi:hypothetical protein
VLNNRNNLFALLDAGPRQIIASHCDLAALKALTHVSSKMRTFFKGHYLDRCKDQFLQLINGGNQDAAEKMLLEQPSLLIHGPVSALQLTLCTRDRHMWTMFLRCLPVNDNGTLTAEAQQIRKNLLAQYQAFKDKGADYYQNSSGLSKLINDLMNLIALYDEMSKEERAHYWVTNIGNSTRNLSISLLQTLCRRDVVFNHSSFREDDFPRTLTVHPYFAKNALSLSPLSDSELGITFAIIPQEIARAAALKSCPIKLTLQEYLSALQRLDSVRTSEIQELGCILANKKLLLPKRKTAHASCNIL